MKRIYTIILTTLLVALFATTGAIAQDNGDFRSTADGDWSATATWQTYDGSDWVAASAAPDGSENITILEGDSVNVASGTVTISGHVTVEGLSEDPFTGGELTADGGTLVFADGGTYQHDRDGGDVPSATWETGSTVSVTGVIADKPGGLDQAYHHLTWNNAGQLSNFNLGWDGYTLAGDFNVLNTGGNQLRLTSANTNAARVITIQGNVLVDGENSEFTATGSGDIADYDITVEGDITVTNDGYLAVSRGSGGRAVWTVHGDLTVENGRLGESNIDKHGQRKSFVFAGSTAQTITGSEVGTSSTLYYEIAAGSDVSVAAGSFPMDSLTVSGDLTLEGELEASGPVVLDGDGTMTVADGGTYTHNYDGGDVPDATWETGSTVAVTGVIGSKPGGLDQAFHNVTWNSDEQVSNFNLGWDDYTLAGDFTVLSTGGNQLRLTSANTDAPRVITIEGNIVVNGENAEFTATGSGDVADYDITVNGNVEVLNNGFLSVSRGSGGRAVWTLYGDMTIDGGKIGDSDTDKHEQFRSFVFAADTVEGAPSQTLSASNVSYDSDVYFEIADSSGITLAADSDFEFEGIFTNYGIFDVDDAATLTFTGEATYNHARDGGDVPTATWEEGSTALFDALVTSGPGNGNQDFYNLVIDSPDLVSNSDFGMRGNTINGDINIMNTGSARIYLTQPDALEELDITIMGDIHMQQGAFSTNGTGNGGSQINVHHYGNVTVEDGNFSISRGSGPLVYWNLYGGNFDFQAGVTQNSDPRGGSAFVFAGEDTVQTLSVTEDVDLANFPWTVDSLAYLDIGTSNFGGMSSIIEVNAGATIASSDSAAFERNVDAQITTLSSEAHYVINGSEEQWTGFALPLQVASLTIDNEAGVTQSRLITINEALILESGEFNNELGITLAEGAEIIENGGTLAIPLDGGSDELPIPEPPYEVGDTLNYNGSFSAAELGDTEVDAWLIEGTDASSWEVVDDAADDDGKALSFTVAHEGENWYSSQAVNEPITVVEGERYTASVYLKGDEDGRLVRFYAGMPESGGYERVRGWDTPQLELTTEWAEYTFDFTATADHAENGMRLAFEFNVDANDGGTIYVDNATLIKQEATSNEINNEIPSDFALSQNYPNPFNPTTNINYDVPEAADVKLQVFDVTGRQVAELVNTRKSAGSYTVQWNAKNFATGVYIYRLTAGDFTSVRKLTLIK